MNDKSKSEELIDSIPRNLNFSLGIPLGDSGYINISSSGYKNEDKIKFKATIEVDTTVEDLDGVSKLVNMLAAAQGK